MSTSADALLSIHALSRTDSLDAGGVQLVGATLREELTEAPIPAGWILEGQPLTRSKILSNGSSDQSAKTMMWDCTAGRFNWFYDFDETIFILEGSVLLTLPSGAQHRLVTGSTFFFANGSRAQWCVERYVRKVAFCHWPMSAKMRRAQQWYSRLRNLLHGSSASSAQGSFSLGPNSH